MHLHTEIIAKTFLCHGCKKEDTSIEFQHDDIFVILRIIDNVSLYKIAKENNYG